MTTQPQRSWAPYALIAIALGLLVLVLKFLISIVWTLSVVALILVAVAVVDRALAERIVRGALNAGRSILVRFQKR